ncbi:hypothetical protein AAG570_013397 [Ranatra chinensis]|uniref:GP-PDE domain-containing protein n=1 Tax=Ranatra chinensis TaxID=642074 RepID=A0ABD0YUL2_9HEMI
MLWTACYGLLVLAIEATNLAVLVGLLAGPLATYYCLKHYAIQPCDPMSVTEVLGIDLEDKTGEDGAAMDIAQDNLVLKVIAHRFAGIDAPENSLAALEACFQRGCIAVEFDVVLTADGIPIVFHDNLLDRMTNTIGEVSKKTWDELSSLDISINHPFHERFLGTNIPQFEDVIKKCLEYDMRLIIDIKDSSNEMTNIICKAYENYPMLYRRAIVTSFNPVVIYNIRSAKPGIIGAMSWRPYTMSCSNYSPKEEECVPYYSSFAAYYLARAADLVNAWLFNNVSYYVVGINLVLIHKDVITPELVHRWKKRNIRVVAWTVNIPSEKMHFSRNLQIPYLTDTMTGD